MRTSVLDLFRLSDVGKEEAFDELSHLAAEMLEVPIALINVITGDVQRSAGACGLDVTSGPRDHAICAYTILKDGILVVPDAQLDERFEDNPLVTGPPFIRFYAGRPLRVGGTRIGALCVIDTKPRQIKERELGLLDGLAKVAERLLECRLGGLLHAESERRIEALVEAMPVAVAVHDPSDRLTRTNALYRKTFLLGQHADLPIGLGFPELLELIEAVSPEIRVGGKSDWKTERLGRRRNRAGPYELQVGSRWLCCDEVVMGDGSLVVAFTDVTELKERETALAAGSALLRSTLESLAEGVAVFDETSTMIASNEAFFDLLEFPRSARDPELSLEAVASSIGTQVLSAPKRDSKIDEDQLLTLLSRGDGPPVEARTTEGSTISIASRKLEDGRLILTCADITEHREIERLKDEFVSTVSHELRTPLTSITGSLDLLAGGAAGEMPPRATRLIDIAHENVKRLSRLVNDLLDIDKIEAGQTEFRRDCIDLRMVSERAVEQNRPYAESFGVFLSYEEPADPVPVTGDLDRLLQVATNLISNAVKYSPEGATVCVTSRLESGKARLSVSDNGPGIPESFRDRLFHRFAQADASDRRAKQGTGLGLPIALAIAARHGGSIEVDTETGRGSTFHLDLPLAATSRSASGLGVGVEILIVEDDSFAGRILQRYLEMGGARVDLAGSIDEARQCLEARRYDALILDLLLPDGNGLELVRHVRTFAGPGDLPIVVVSGFTDIAQHSAEAGELGILNWIEKPVDLARLARILAHRSDDTIEKPRILHIEDDNDTSRVVALTLRDVAIVDRAENLATARRRLAETRYNAAILDLALPDGLGADLLPDLAAAPDGPVPTIIFSVNEPPDGVVTAVSDSLVKSRSSFDQLTQAVRRHAARKEPE